MHSIHKLKILILTLLVLCLGLKILLFYIDRNILEQENLLRETLHENVVEVTEKISTTSRPTTSTKRLTTTKTSTTSAPITASSKQEESVVSTMKSSSALLPSTKSLQLPLTKL